MTDLGDVSSRHTACSILRISPMVDWNVPPRVLIVDDSEQQVRLLQRVLQVDGCDCAAVGDGGQAFEAARSLAPDVILLDVELPHIDGLSICRRLKSTRETALIPVLMMTGQAGAEHELYALEAGADDFLPKPTPLALLRARLRSAIALKRSIDGLDDAAASILMLASAIEARDPLTKGHGDRLAGHAVRLGRRLGLEPDDLRALQLGGYLHDLGKVAVPDAVLFKRDRLTASEWEAIKVHPLAGDRICAPLRTLERVRPIIRSHHERLGGDGYPDGLAGSAIPLLAQITAIADIYDALTSERSYRRRLSHDGAAEVLRAEAAAGARDRLLVDEFLRGLDLTHDASAGVGSGLRS